MLQQLSSNPTAPDSIIVRSPLPGGVAAIVRYLFNLPAWFQIAGAVAGVLVATALLILVWLRRRALLAWLRSRSHTTLVALGSAAAVAAAAAVAFGAVSWNYTQHNNDFCASCHVMNSAYSRFQTSGHRQLQCHACHEQSIFVSIFQVYYWVAERPQSIPPHAKVPNGVCARCHITAHPDSIWQRINTTAGHSVHLNSDTAPLRNIQCVTCHGVEIHHFAPLDKTCGQSGCHDHIRIRLGTMAAQTDLHCTGCHSFIAPVAEHISRDSAAAVMIPAGPQCLACHAMQQVTKDFDIAHDPHHGRCGWCHDPHTQTTPQDALATCTNAGCHSQPATLTPFHRGISASALAKCSTCHTAHAWTVQSSACINCHRDIYTPGHARRTTAPAPAGRSATAAALASIMRFAGLVRPEASRAGAVADAAAPMADSLPPFSHARHRGVSCTTCHSSAHSHGELTLHSGRDCMACHHATDQHVDCTTCHAPTSLPSRPGVPTTMAMSVWPTPRARTLPFAHASHARVACRTCHTAPLTLAMQDRTCTSCHADHHTPAASCLSCHTPSRSSHTRAAHLGCGGSGCHTDAAVLALGPARNVCLVCHQTLVDHHPGRECAGCHAVVWRPVAALPSPQ